MIRSRNNRTTLGRETPPSPPSRVPPPGMVMSCDSTSSASSVSSAHSHGLISPVRSGEIGEHQGRSGEIGEIGGDQERSGEIGGDWGRSWEIGGNSTSSASSVSSANSHGVISPVVRGEIRGDQGRSGEIGGDQGRSGEIEGDWGRLGKIWGDRGRSGEIQGDPGRSREIRGDSTSSAPSVSSAHSHGVISPVKRGEIRGD